jgi:hypothetical protein
MLTKIAHQRGISPMRCDFTVIHDATLQTDGSRWVGRPVVVTGRSALLPHQRTQTTPQTPMSSGPLAQLSLSEERMRLKTLKIPALTVRSAQ